MPGTWARQLVEQGVEVVCLGRKPGFHPSLGREIARLAAERGMGVLHCHHYSPFVYGRIAALCRPSLRLIYTEHGRLSDARPTIKQRTVNPLLSLFPGCVCAVSEDLRQYMLAAGFLSWRVSVVRNGIDPGPAPDESLRRSARRALGLAEETLVVGSVGRLDPVKDLGTLIEAFSVLGRADAVLLIVGDGPERPRLERLSESLGCAGSVIFTGHRDDVRRVLPALDVYVNCSVTEGMSVTILEAMAAGLPVVATAVGGNPELVQRGLTGLLVLSRSPRSLANAVGRLLGSPDDRAAMGAAARARVVAEFSLDRMLREYLAAYGVAGGA